MPTVPRITEQKVKLQPLPGVRLTTAGATEETFGGGTSLEQVGEASRSLSQIGMKYAVVQKRNADEVVVQEADNKAAIFQTDLELEIEKLKGKDAAGAYDKAKTDWSKMSEELDKSLANSEQKAALRSKLNTRFIKIQDYVKKHSAAQQVWYDNQVTEGGITVRREEAARKYTDDSIIDSSIAQQEQLRMQQAVRNGLSPKDDKTRSMIDQDISATVAKVYNNRIIAGMENEAEALRKKYSEFLTDEDKKAMDTTKTQVVKKIESEQKAHLDAVQFQNGQNLAKEALLGRFNDLTQLERLRTLGEAGDPRGISTTLYSTIKSYLTDPQVEASFEARQDLLFGIPEAYFNIDSDRDGEVDQNVKFEDIARFREVAFAAYQNGAITQQELQGKIENTEKAFTQGIMSQATKSHRNGQTMWKFYNKWFSDNLAGFKVVENGVAYKQPINEEEQKQAMAFVGNAIMDYMRTNDIPDEKVPELTQMFLGKYLVQRYPELTGKTGLPNAIATAEASFKKVFAGKSDYKPDFTISGAEENDIPEYDPMTQKLQRNRKTGQYRVVPL